MDRPHPQTTRHILAACFAVALSLISATASANLVSNSGFETGDFTSWTQSGNEGFTFVDGTPHSGKFAAWLGPEGPSLGFLSQQLSTIPDAQYELDFWLRHEPFGTGKPNIFEVFWGGELVDQMTVLGSLPLTNVGSFPYTEVQLSLTAPSALTELQFGFMEDTDYFQLDDVSVLPASMPEPGTLILLASGLMALLAYAQRSPS